jgi:hypothetical protein
MKKVYKDYQDKPLTVSEPTATYDVRTDTQHAPLLQGMPSANEVQRISAAKEKFALRQDLTVEELYDVIADEIDSIYANG